MRVTLSILRYDPERDEKPHFVDYELEVAPTDRLLDALNEIKWHVDGSLTYRRSCAHGICGSDGMLINGKNRLACKCLIRDLVSPGDSRIIVEPMRGYRVIKDLVIDLEPFFESYRAMLPYLINDEPPPARERLQSPEQRERYDDTTKCILCAICTTACPPFWANPNFVGPAAIVNAHRFIYDNRDEGTEERLDALNEKTGVWRCRTVFNCTEACPRGIKITDAIEQIKRELLFRRT